MKKGRLEAFSDGVIAIIITIMVLELHVPEGHHVKDLVPMLPILLSYVLSFVNVGIYWNNHHHMIYAAEKINGGILWANLNLLFWLSLLPFVTAWVGESHFAQWPVILYGGVLIMNGIAYTILCRLLIKEAGPDSELAIALGRDWKGKASVVIYSVAIALAFVSAYIALGLYVLVAVMWFVPDRRIEKRMAGTGRRIGAAHDLASTEKCPYIGGNLYPVQKSTNVSKDPTIRAVVFLPVVILPVRHHYTWVATALIPYL